MNTKQASLWVTERFTQIYRKLDEDWQTKTNLYREIATIIDSKSNDFNYRGRILDLGGGLGTLAAISETYLRNQPIKTWVVYDLAQAMMRAGTVTKGCNWPWLCFIQGNALQKFAFASDQFDIVVSVNVLYQFGDAQHRDQIACEIMRVLKPGGYLIVTNPLPSAKNSRIIWEEVQLRQIKSGLGRAISSVALDVFTNLSFLGSQRKLLKSANKKSPDEWAELYTEATTGQLRLSWSGISQTYAGQAGIWVMEKYNYTSDLVEI